MVFVWEALNGTIALLCCHVSMKLDVGLTKCILLSGPGARDWFNIWYVYPRLSNQG